MGEADKLKISKSIKLLVEMKNMSFILQKKTKLTFWPTWYLPKGHENICSHKDLYMNAHGSFVCKSSKLERAQVPTNRYVDQPVVEEEHIIDTAYMQNFNIIMLSQISQTFIFKKRKKGYTIIIKFTQNS